jgi:hypothetical protein
MDRQVSHIVPFITVSPDDNTLRLGTIINEYTIAFVKICLGIEVWVNLELDVSKRHIQDTVERKEAEVI